jgi:murein L,D-transpeptidase YcbB/YkuD
MRGLLLLAGAALVLSAGMSVPALSQTGETANPVEAMAEERPSLLTGAVGPAAPESANNSGAPESQSTGDVTVAPRRSPNEPKAESPPAAGPSGPAEAAQAHAAPAQAGPASPHPSLSEAEIAARVPPAEPAGLPPPTLNDALDVPVADVAPADQPVALELRETMSKRLERLIGRKMDRSAIEAFYAGRGFAPLWIENGAPSTRAQAAIATLKAADSVGLDPDDYAIPQLAGLDHDPRALAEAELRLTTAVLLYARHAQAGRTNPRRISSNIEYPVPVPEIRSVLEKVATAKDVAEAIDGFNPPHPAFKALKAKLAELRKGRGEAGPRIPGGPVIKPRAKDPRVPLIRERLGVGGDPADTTYDGALVEAVKRFQKSHGLPATGTITGSTLDALNGPPQSRHVDIILANMERLRWLPRDLGAAHVIVNIPEFMLRVYHNGTQVWRTKIVVGKPTTPTPLTTAMMKYITVNPTWNVPPSIVQNEYLPVLRQDPDALARIGLRVSYRPDGSLHISQPPGDGNALGRIRFNFPNRFLVYQHDTPDKHLFGHDRRAYSHGCMRVQDPFKYGEVLLSIARPKDGYTQERLRAMVGPAERDIQFQVQIPVHLTYQTAFVDETGRLVFRDDIYGLDARVLAALKGDQVIADFAAPAGQMRQVEARPAREARPPRRVARRGDRIERREAHRGGFTLFDLFFR